MDVFHNMNDDILDFVMTVLKSRNLFLIYCPHDSLMEICEPLVACVSIYVLPL